jgi:hypothetical protein
LNRALHQRFTIAEGRGRTGRVIRIDESDGTEPPPFPTVAVQ